MGTFPEFAEHDFSKVTEGELAAHLEQLECKLADQHPRDIARLFNSICALVVEVHGCLHPSHVASVIDWSVEDLRDYLQEVLRGRS